MVTPSDCKLSVVIMNWARPANVVRFATLYARHPRVNEVIIWDPSRDRPLSDLALDAVGPAPVRYIRTTHDFGLYPRYTLGAMGFEHGVLICDDDIELPDGTITALHDEYLKDPSVIHGLFGRIPHEDGTYTAPTSHGPVQVVLTRALVTSPWLCGRAMSWGARHLREIPGQPRGNGEDIVLSHVAMAESGRLNCAYKMPYANKGYDDSNAISVRVKGHAAHRTAMVRWCRQNILGGSVPQA